MKKPNLYLGETPVHGINVHSTKDQVGIDTSDATATEADVLDGKTFYAQNEQKTGTIVSKGQSDLQVNGPKITTPAGYYPTNVSKEVATITTLAAPEITIDSENEIIKAKYTQQNSGYVANGTEAIGTKKINIQAGTAWGLNFNNKQVITLLNANTYLTGDQIIERDENLTSSNIRSGVSIYGVPGNYSPSASYTTLSFTGNGVWSASQPTYINGVPGQALAATLIGFQERNNGCIWYAVIDFNTGHMGVVYYYSDQLLGGIISGLVSQSGSQIIIQSTSASSTYLFFSNTTCSAQITYLA